MYEENEDRFLSAKKHRMTLMKHRTEDNTVQEVGVNTELMILTYRQESNEKYYTRVSNAQERHIIRTEERRGRGKHRTVERNFCGDTEDRTQAPQS